MNTSKPKILYADIENIPCVGWFWRSGKQVVDSTQILDTGRIICISYLWDHEKKAKTVSWTVTQSDKQLLIEFSKIAEQADVVIGHNLEKFDVRNINARLAFHGLKPINWMLLDDTLKQLRGAMNLPSFKLGYVCEYFGLGSKIRTGGMDLWKDVWLKNDRTALEKMCKYCEGDVYLAKALSHKISPYVKVKMNYQKFTNNEVVCKACGGSTCCNGTRRTTKGLFQIRQCKACGKKQTDGKRINESKKI